MPEVLIVILIVMILIAIAAPPMNRLLQRYRMSTTVSDFYAALQLARSEAIRRGERIDLVPAEDASEWSGGWAVMHDRNGNRRADENDDLIYSHGPLPAGMVVVDGFRGAGPRYFAYNGSGYGRNHGSSQAARAGSWTFMLGEEKRKIIINFTGRPRLCNPRTEPGDC